MFSPRSAARRLFFSSQVHWLQYRSNRPLRQSPDTPATARGFGRGKGWCVARWCARRVAVPSPSLLPKTCFHRPVSVPCLVRCLALARAHARTQHQMVVWSQGHGCADLCPPPFLCGSAALEQKPMTNLWSRYWHLTAPAPFAWPPCSSDLVSCHALGASQAACLSPRWSVDDFSLVHAPDLPHHAPLQG